MLLAEVLGHAAADLGQRAAHYFTEISLMIPESALGDLQVL